MVLSSDVKSVVKICRMAGEADGFTSIVAVLLQVSPKSVCETATV
jgi:hypothetical protein